MAKRANIFLSVKLILIIVIIILASAAAYLVYQRYFATKQIDPCTHSLCSETKNIPPTKDNPVVVFPRDPEVRSQQKIDVQVGYYNKDTTAKCVSFSILDDQARQFKTVQNQIGEDPEKISILEVSLPNDCRKIGKDEIIRWKFSMTGHNNESQYVVNVISAQVNIYPYQEHVCECTGEHINLTQDIILTVYPKP